MKIKVEAEKKNFIANGKADCLTIYKTESDKWNNVLGWTYDEEYETCLIRYSEQIPKTTA